MDRFHRMEEAARLLGIHPQTLRAWDVQGKIRVVRTPGGKRRVPESEIRRLQGEPVADAPKRVAAWAIYARVSSHEQKTRGDLARQVVHLRENLAASGVSPPAGITDVASGLSDKRPGLLRRMAMARQGRITDNAITYRDRLTRFGFGYLEEFFSGYGVKIHVVDGQGEHWSVQEELCADLIAMVTSFSGKLYGLRSPGKAKALVEAVKELVAGDGGPDAGGA
jgi:excisionase family DNA binding protein